MVGTAAILLPRANASTASPPIPELFSLQQATRLGANLTAGLGESETAGWYYDGKDRRLVVNVVDGSAASHVKAMGAVPRVVKNSAARLQAVTRKLGSTAAIPGTAWSIDPKTNKVSVIADSTVSGSKWDTLMSATHDVGGLVTVSRSAGTFERFAVGGDPIHDGGAMCSLGFNVSLNGAPAFLTAGHCGNAGETMTTEDGAQGTVVTSGFPQRDYALVSYADPSVAAPSEVRLANGGTQPITQAVEASVGMQVTRSGVTSGVHSGVVTGLNATVNYSDGPSYGLIETDVCSEPGDSGGPLFSGNSAVGLTSGGDGDCSQGGTTFFHPVTDALQATGAVLGTSGGTGNPAGGGAAGDTGAGAGGAVEDGTGGAASGGSGGAVGGSGSGSVGGGGGASGGGTGGSSGGGTSGGPGDWPGNGDAVGGYPGDGSGGGYPGDGSGGGYPDDGSGGGLPDDGSGDGFPEFGVGGGYPDFGMGGGYPDFDGGRGFADVGMGGGYPGYGSVGSDPGYVTGAVDINGNDLAASRWQ